MIRGSTACCNTFCVSPLPKYNQMLLQRTVWEYKTPFVIAKSRYAAGSDAVLAETSLRSPRKLFIFIIKKYIYRIKVTKKKWIYFEKNFTDRRFTWPDPTVSGVRKLVVMRKALYSEIQLYTLSTFDTKSCCTYPLSMYPHPTVWMSTKLKLAGSCIPT